MSIEKFIDLPTIGLTRIILGGWGEPSNIATIEFEDFSHLYFARLKYKNGQWIKISYKQSTARTYRQDVAFPHLVFEEIIKGIANDPDLSKILLKYVKGAKKRVEASIPKLQVEINEAYLTLAKLKNPDLRSIK